MSSSPRHSSFLLRILGAIGAGSACAASLAGQGCGDVVVTSGASNSAGPGGGSTSSAGTGGEGGASTASSSTSGVIFDAGKDATPGDCQSQLKSSTQEPPPGGPCVLDAGSYGNNYNCFAPPAPGASCADAYTDACVLTTYSCGLSMTGNAIACGPVTNAQGACCYLITGDCFVGRPLTIGGRARLAALVRGEGWSEPLAPEMTGLDAATRAALAEVWGREALFEHASIASFARFVIQLLAIGAPSDLVLLAQRALAEEHDHARACLGLASAYTGEPLGFGPLAIDGALDESGDPAAIAASLARDGCVTETVAAIQVGRARDEARDPVVKAALARIADQEADHAALAWRALAWMLERGGDPVRAAVAKVFAEAEAHVALGATTDRDGDGPAMRAHGYLPLEERRALAREALERVVAPAAAALLGRRRGALRGRAERSPHG